jgi:hypothetical protein
MLRMPYRVLDLAALTAKASESTTSFLEHVEQGLNAMEADGWTLTHVHADADPEAKYTEWFVFHKPVERTT